MRCSAWLALTLALEIPAIGFADDPAMAKYAVQVRLAAGRQIAASRRDRSVNIWSLGKPSPHLTFNASYY